MSQGAFLYPASQVIAQIIRNSGYSPTGFLWAIGHADAVLPDLESWLVTGEGPRTLIVEIAAAYPDEAQGLYRAVAETKVMIADGVDPADLERARKIARFVPFLLAVGERRVTTQITMFGISGGFERWCVIRIPKRILRLPLDEQFSRLPKLMNRYRRCYGGQVPFFGPLRTFLYLRALDHFRFNPDGGLIERVDKPFRLGECWVELR